ncbi:VOC family protein [Mobilicoccus massiliensis]|uniref:VOC family protein n=1 Tax=Mobilicoccus massiliensis TaxID=1522310 RepID=UPI00058E1214|nr:VOC family protein [Mobilicoccus massiliensis]
MRLYSAVVDCVDVRAQARWWADALGWNVVFESGHEASISPPHAEGGDVEDKDEFDRVSTGVCFVPVPEGKTAKNRVHLDFAPHSSEDRDAIIARLLEAGATRVDVGQPHDASFTVLADPEGNEFCILSARRS